VSEVIEWPAESTALVAVKAALPTIIAADSDDILGKLARELSGFRPDVSTETGRKEIASKARKAAVAKMDLIRLAGTLKADHQKVLKGIIAEEKIITERMDGLRDSIRAPLTEFEQRDERRIKAHEDALAEIAGWSDVPVDATAADIAARLAALDSSPLLERNWEEFRERARELMRTEVNNLNVLHAAAETREAEAAELERLRAEAADRARQEAARQQAEREAKIAREAAEAARVAAEEAAARVAQEAAAAAEAERQKIVREAREREEAAERAAQAEREAAAERERLAAEALAREQRQRREAEDRMERARVLRHETHISQIEDAAKGFGPDTPSSHIKGRMDLLHDGWGGAGADWQEFAERAAEARRDTHLALQALYEKAVEAERQDARRRAEFAKAEAERRELAAAEAAREAERQRVAREEAAERKAAETRLANKTHRAKINGEALDAIMEAMSEAHPGSAAEANAIGRAIIVAIAKGSIPHVSIKY
jgi:hypothetical protein